MFNKQKSPSCSRRAGCKVLLCAVLAIGAVQVAGWAHAETTVKVGIVGGEDEEVWKVVARQAAKKGITIKTVVFKDYTQPNEALERGGVDANAFQHKPCLD